MITIVLTYRNRELVIVKKCLESLLIQKNKDFKLILVDYGSNNVYKKGLEHLLKAYSFVKLIRCETTQQLWCKSRAINLALKEIETPYCFVGDIDMMYHPECIEVMHAIKLKNDATYFQVGFLSQEESKQEKVFNEYKINFKSKPEATGMTLYSTKLLKSINGYDEFYNGWGSEDTDVHVRLQNGGYQVSFFTDRILMLHQWHPKNYRKKNDLAPFHSTLEKINAQYLSLVERTKKVKANINTVWGSYDDNDYVTLDTVDHKYTITNKEGELSAFINAVLLVEKEKVIELEITAHKDYKSTKQKAKTLLGKKTIAFAGMQSINDNLLETIVSHLRNQAYQYEFDAICNTIKLTIKL